MKHQKEFKKVESIINRHLYQICYVITILVMLMFLIEFFTRGYFSLTRIEIFYLGVLVLYSIHKELIRFIGHRKIEKQGEIFVYIWIGITLSLFVINFFSRDYFAYTIDEKPSLVLHDISLLTVQILGIFLLTRISKFIRAFLEYKSLTEKKK